MLAHLAQEYVAVLNLGEDFVRPNSGIGHPGMQAPFGIYETRDGGYVSIAMSPFKTLYEMLEAPQLAVYDDLKTLFDKRDEVWRRSTPRRGSSPPRSCWSGCSPSTSGAPRSRTSARRRKTRRSSTWA